MNEEYKEEKITKQQIEMLMKIFEPCFKKIENKSKARVRVLASNKLDVKR